MTAQAFRDFLRKPGVIPAAALIITLGVGALALPGLSAREAALASTPVSTPTSAPTTVVTQDAAPAASSTTVSIAPRTEIAVTTPIVYLTEGDAPTARPSLPAADLDLAAQQMTEDDKATFDQLRTVVTGQQVALSSAQAKLEATRAEIAALIVKYSATSTALAATAASTTVTSNLPR